MVRSTIPRQVFAWLREQTFLAIATIDGAGHLWATVVPGKPGFLQPDASGTHLWVERTMPQTVLANLKSGGNIGLLAIDLISRQRMRINGTATALPAGLHVSVQEAFFNCPKYITRRTALPSETDGERDEHEGSRLLAEHLQLLSETDVLFLATTHPERGLDVSHRGGDPGFVQLLPDGRIRIPDYTGNSLFNSLGNLLIDPRIGIAIPNLRTGTILQITGTATVAWHDRDEDDSTGGTHRFVDITPVAWHTEEGGPVSRGASELSPFNPHPHAA
ncbi:pyridoxamine 5'-phosphate oxidase family protein [Terriglobus sp. TAA 43]|uniref:pyridoxamine 5'-phosphate oxidase family protein n=1 Tax=Terriglobus sp. TAA 43 TaxID=278961 RepID=UPI001E4A5B0C|nr:pyridoxamine 5'-phosphate oxidase family protein [Terriglobus sp. TAA 43]